MHTTGPLDLEASLVDAQRAAGAVLGPRSDPSRLASRRLATALERTAAALTYYGARLGASTVPLPQTEHAALGLPRKTH